MRAEREEEEGEGRGGGRMLLFQNIPDYDTTGFHSTTTFASAIAVHVRACVYCRYFLLVITEI